MSWEVYDSSAVRNRHIPRWTHAGNPVPPYQHGLPSLHGRTRPIDHTHSHRRHYVFVDLNELTRGRRQGVLSLGWSGGEDSESEYRPGAGEHRHRSTPFLHGERRARR